MFLIVLLSLCSWTWASSPGVMFPSYKGLVQDMMYKRLLDDHATFKDGIQLKARENGETSLRDQEYLEHGAINGPRYQYISGGAGEGKQHLTPEGKQDNTQEVKSDDVLPFYCHPPNPCPKGKAGSTDCMDSIPDTAQAQQAWISEMQQKGICECDEEHMFNCPAEGKNKQIKQVFDELMDENSVENAYMDMETKRETVVAKKSPRNIEPPSMKRKKRSTHAKNKNRKRENPYLKGEKLKRVAKKG